MAVHIVRALADAGFDVVVVHRWGGPLIAEIDAAATRSLVPLANRLRAWLHVHGRRRTADTLERAAAWRLLRRERPDIVWCNTVVTAQWARVATSMRIPVVLHAHEGPDWLLAARDRLPAADAKATLVGCSPDAVDGLAAAVGVPAGAVILLPSAVDVAAIRRRVDAEHQSPGPVDGQVLVVGCGRANAGKGFDVFCAAASASATAGDRWVWRWIGGVTDDDRPVDVDCVGEVDDPGSHISRATVMVLPSRADRFPLVVLEAMTIGTPVVASDLPGPRAQLGDHGVFVEPSDPIALLAAVRALVGDPTRRAVLARGARARVEQHWDVEEFSRRVVEIAKGAALREPASADRHASGS